MRGSLDARRLSAEALAHHPHPAEAEVAMAEKELAPFLEGARKEFASSIPAWQDVLILLLVGMLRIMAPLGLVLALAIPGGLLLRLFGIALVDREGNQATRWLSFQRAVVVWWTAPFGRGCRCISSLAPYGCTNRTYPGNFLRRFALRRVSGRHRRGAREPAKESAGSVSRHLPRAEVSDVTRPMGRPIPQPSGPWTGLCFVQWPATCGAAMGGPQGRNSQFFDSPGRAEGREGRTEDRR